MSWESFCIPVFIRFLILGYGSLILPGDHDSQIQYDMLTQPISVTFEIGNGNQISIETGKLARQADGAVTVKQGNCIILATVVANTDPKEGQEFLPLSVDYQEKF